MPQIARNLALAAVVCYAAMWLGFRQDWGWLHTADWALLDAAHDVGVKHPGWVRFWQDVCVVFGPSAFRLAAMVAAVLELVRRRLRPALFLLVAVELGGLVSRLAKHLGDRTRPDTRLVAVPESSFPSGHALAVMVGVLALLTVVWPLLHRSARITAGTAGAVIVLAVGIGRVALNVHHPSDVLAGWALGYLWFLVCAQLLLVNAPGGRRPGPAPRSVGSPPVCP